jgi:hypothetical protein
MLDINKLQDLINNDAVTPTQHFMYRIENRHISIDDVIYSIENGEIIEYYPNDYPYPSALILGYTQKGKPIHCVAGIGNNKLWLITAYCPDLYKWEADYKTRKAENK